MVLNFLEIDQKRQQVCFQCRARGRCDDTGVGCVPAATCACHHCTFPTITTQHVRSMTHYLWYRIPFPLSSPLLSSLFSPRDRLLRTVTESPPDYLRAVAYCTFNSSRVSHCKRRLQLSPELLSRLFLVQRQSSPVVPTCMKSVF